MDDFSRLRLLVIEDQPEMRSMLRNMLMEMGLAIVYEACDGREGLDIMTKNYDPPDIVLCDWQMPHLDGLGVLRRMRSEHVMTPFVMVTGRCDQNAILEAKQAGVQTYIHKPFDPDQLEARLRALYHRHYLPPAFR